MSITPSIGKEKKGKEKGIHHGVTVSQEGGNGKTCRRSEQVSI